MKDMRRTGFATEQDRAGASNADGCRLRLEIEPLTAFKTLKMNLEICYLPTPGPTAMAPSPALRPSEPAELDNQPAANAVAQLKP
jgi:hypothetical protein